VNQNLARARARWRAVCMIKNLHTKNARRLRLWQISFKVPTKLKPYFHVHIKDPPNGPYDYTIGHFVY